MIKFFKKRSGISSSRVVVRPHVSWQLRLMVILGMCLFVLLLSWGMYEAGKRVANKDERFSSQKERVQLYDAGTCLKKDRESLCTQLAELTRQFQILQTTNDDLAKQTKELSKENMFLKGELDFFEHVMTGSAKIDSGIAIHHFNLKKDSNPGLYRYTLSLVQGGQRPKDFHGSLKFMVNLRQHDQTKKIMLTKKNAQQNFSVSFKFYHRIEENFRVPPDTIVESMEVQVYEQNDNQARLTQTVELSM